MKVHQRVSQHIDEMGIMRSRVAERSGISKRRFWRIINGESEMTADEYEVICRDGLSIDPAFFFSKRK